MLIKELDCTCNNMKIYTKIYIPDDESEKYPLVILAHGLSANHTWLEYYAEKLVQSGIASCLFDFRGNSRDSKSEGKLTDSSVLTNVDDLEIILNNIRQLKFIDNNRIYLLGHSQAGLVSALVANKYPDYIKSLFLLAPAFNIPDEMEKTPLPHNGELLKNIAGFIGRKYILDALQVKIYDEVKNYNSKVYIFHGQDDIAVPIRYSYKADKVYENSQLIIVPNQRHNFSDEGKDVVIQYILEEIRSVE